MKKKISHKNAAVYIFNKELNSILVHQRGKPNKKFPYTILTPGGRKEKGEKIQETAIREIKEETGIVLQESELVEVGSSNTTKHYLVYYNPDNHTITGPTKNQEEVLVWTLSDIGIDAGDNKNRWMTWNDLIICKQNPKMHPKHPEDNLGYLHPALMNKFQGGVWNIKRKGYFRRDVKCLIKKF